MNFVIKQVDEAGVVSYYDGSVFVPNASDAKIIVSVQDARYLQGSFQSQFVQSEISKVAATVSVSLA